MGLVKGGRAKMVGCEKVAPVNEMDGRGEEEVG